MNGVAEPPGGTTSVRWFVPTKPDFDFIVGRSHAYELPAGEVTPNHYVAACGDSTILNEDSRESDDNHCIVCQRNLGSRRAAAD